MRFVRVLAAAPLWVLAASSVSFAQTELTLEDALMRARARAPEILAATSRIDEARAQLLTAGALRENPVVAFEAGPRQSDVRRTIDLSASFEQTFETGGQRGARLAGAQAGVDRAASSADETVRRVLRDVAVAFIRGLAADERVRLLSTAEGLADQLRAAAERRYQLGDIAALDVNLTRIAATRARADRLRAEADRADALQPLRLALGVAPDERLALRGSLDRAPAPRERLVSSIERSPALRVIDAEIAQARADLRLGQGLRRPDLGTIVSVRREQDDRIVTGGFTLTLPMFQRGQTQVADADARVRRLAMERDATRRTLDAQLTSALAAFAQRRQAADELRSGALPAADDNEGLATRSLDAGEISVLNLLLVRQDVTAARLAHLDALADAAVASVEIDSLAGVLR